jgi:hypothetical protein
MCEGFGQPYHLLATLLPIINAHIIQNNESISECRMVLSFVSRLNAD